MPNKWKTERDTTFLFVRYGRVVVPKFAVTFYKATFAFSGQNLITSGVKKLRYVFVYYLSLHLVRRFRSENIGGSKKLNCPSHPSNAYGETKGKRKFSFPSSPAPCP